MLHITILKENKHDRHVHVEITCQACTCRDNISSRIVLRDHEFI